jgi:hypothetical protein
MRMFNRFISTLITLSLILIPLGAAQAAMVGNSQLLNEQTSDMRLELSRALERDQVRTQLTQLGVDAETVKLRLAQMTDQEIATLNERLGDLPAGGDAVGVILFLFVLFIVTDAIGATDIFPFVHPVR